VRARARVPALALRDHLAQAQLVERAAKVVGVAGLGGRQLARRRAAAPQPVPRAHVGVRVGLGAHAREQRVQPLELCVLRPAGCAGPVKGASGQERGWRGGTCAPGPTRRRSAPKYQWSGHASSRVWQPTSASRPCGQQAAAGRGCARAAPRVRRQRRPCVTWSADFAPCMNSGPSSTGHGAKPLTCAGKRGPQVTCCLGAWRAWLLV